MPNPFNQSEFEDQQRERQQHMSKLKAKDPTTAELTKPKMVLYGPSGVGKTWFSLSFPNVYYIAPEDGASRKHYTDRLKAGGGVYLGPEDGALEFETVIEQLKALASETHPYKTVVIDSITKLFNHTIAIEAERLGDKNAFGADKKPAVAFMRRLVNAVARLDMNVLLIAHEKAEWGTDDKGNRVETGKVADCWDKLIYELDLAFLAQKRGQSRYGVTKKSRLTGFPEGESFKLDYADFSERYGKDIIEKSVAVVALANADQIAEITRLVTLLNINNETVGKWLEKAKADSLAELNTNQADKIIASLKSKIK